MTAAVAAWARADSTAAMAGGSGLQTRMAAGQPRHGSRHERPDGGREAGQAHLPGGQPHMGGELGVGGIDASDGLGRAAGQQLSGLGEPGPAPDPLQQLRAGLGLDAREVVGNRRLGVVQLPRRCRDRSVGATSAASRRPGTSTAPQHGRHHRDLAPRLRNGRDARRLQRSALLRLNPVTAIARVAEPVRDRRRPRAPSRRPPRRSRRWPPRGVAGDGR